MWSLVSWRPRRRCSTAASAFPQSRSWTSGVGCGAWASKGYEAAFRENEIDDTVLPSLTAEDLKDLGVGIVGHRRKMLDGIAVLRRL